MPNIQKLETFQIQAFQKFSFGMIKFEIAAILLHFGIVVCNKMAAIFWILNAIRNPNHYNIRTILTSKQLSTIQNPNMFGIRASIVPSSKQFSESFLSSTTTYACGVQLGSLHPHPSSATVELFNICSVYRQQLTPTPLKKN